MIEIKQIEPTKANLAKFTQFQIELYEGNPYYVPPLISDDIATLLPEENPAFDFCESAYFMAYRDGPFRIHRLHRRPSGVGRVA